MMEYQKQVVDALQDVLAHSPNIRVGQCLAHLGFMAECYKNEGLGIIEDKDFLIIIRTHLAELLQRDDKSHPRNSNLLSGGMSLSNEPVA